MSLRFESGRRRVGLGYVLLVWWLALLAAAPVSAQSAPSKETLARYRELISKALQEYSLGHWPEARVFFSDAHSLWPNARTLRGLGMACYEGRNYVDAVSYLEGALANKTQPLTPKLAAEAKSILDQAKRFVSALHLTVEPEDADVSVDDEPAKYRSDGSIWLDPGEHAVQVTHAGFDSERRTVHAEAGRDLHMRIELRSSQPLQPAAAAQSAQVKLSPQQPPAQTPRASARTRLTLAGQSATAAGALSAVGVAGIATGWVFYALRNKLRLELWNQGILAEDGQAASFEQGQYNQFQLRGGIALAAGGVGALALSLAQYFWLPDDEATPAWAWVLGGIGTALALSAVAWAVLGTHCEVTDKAAFCNSTASDPLFAPMLGLHAVPLLSVPLLYLVRQRVPARDPIVTLGGANGGAMIQLAGRF